ncbi:retrovirus-related pol polyprotein from transposon TNT 1-94 [Tanacetum coccineum]
MFLSKFINRQFIYWTKSISSCHKFDSFESGNDLLTGSRDLLSTHYLFKKTNFINSNLFPWLKLPQNSSSVIGIDGLSHLNFDYITFLSKKEVVNGLPKLKYVKDQLCSSCEMSKAKRSSFKTKAVPRKITSKRKAKFTSHGLVVVQCALQAIMGRSYILVIVMDLSRYTGLFFIRSKDDKNRSTEFLNKTLHAYFKEEGIEHQTSTPQILKQKRRFVERWNCTLVEAARMMLSASKLPYHSGLKQLQPHAILRTDQSSYPLMERRHITS